MAESLETLTGLSTDQSFTRVTGTPAPLIGTSDFKRSLDIDQSQFEELTEVASSVITYRARTYLLGSGTDEANWQLWREVTTGGVVRKQFAEKNGSAHAGFVHVWDDRATLFPTATFFNNKSVEFDGVNDYLNAGNVFNYDNADQWSLSMWVRPNNVSAQRALFAKVSNDVNVFGWGLYHTATGALLWQMRASGQLRQHTTTLGLSALTWTHVVVTYNGGQNIDGTRFYFDSVVGATPSSGAVTATLLGGYDATFGARNAGFYFSGHMDEISVWDKALSSTEVAAIYNSGSPLNVADLSFSSNLVSYYRCGDGDTHPTILDNVGVNDLTMTGMSSSSFTTEVP